MKITEDVRKYAAEQGVSEQEALRKGMDEKSREFVKKGAELYTQDLSRILHAPAAAERQRLGAFPLEAATTQ